MDYLRQLTLRRKRAHAKFLRMDSQAYKKFLEVEEAAFRDGELSAKTKELIAIGIADPNASRFFSHQIELFFSRSYGDGYRYACHFLSRIVDHLNRDPRLPVVAAAYV